MLVLGLSGNVDLRRLHITDLHVVESPSKVRQGDDNKSFSIILGVTETDEAIDWHKCVVPLVNWMLSVSWND